MACGDGGFCGFTHLPSDYSTGARQKITWDITWCSSRGTQQVHWYRHLVVSTFGASLYTPRILDGRSMREDLPDVGLVLVEGESCVTSSVSVSRGSTKAAYCRLETPGGREVKGISDGSGYGGGFLTPSIIASAYLIARLPPSSVKPSWPYCHGIMLPVFLLSRWMQ